MSERHFTRQVCLWLTDGDLARLDLLVRRAGISRRAYLRHLIRGVVPADRPPPDYFAMTRELSAIGNNLNQIAHVANATGDIDGPLYRQNVAALDEAIARITEAVAAPRRRG
jgi:hypothetical protein